ncbi:hypothetical protein ACFQFH_19280 [Halobaculum halobium]|uniref:hypothetical protein n=1 Tax=Halobaculum halobium TaxID=3032281 RepID=UPI00361E35AA
MSANDTLPITIEGGVTLSLSGVWLRETASSAGSVFDLKPNATVYADGAMLSESSGVGSWFRFNADLESIASQDQTAVYGYPRVDTTNGTPIVEFRQTNGNSVVGGYAEVHAWNAGGVARFHSGGANGWANMNRVEVRGNVSAGEAFVFDYDDGVEVTLNVVNSHGLNFTGGDRIALFDNADSTTAGVRANVLRGTMFDVASVTTPWEWTANCDSNNKVIRRWPTVAAGINDSGDETNEAVADMTI